MCSGDTKFIDRNSFATGSTPVCGWRFEPADDISNSEAYTLELLENLEDMFPRYLVVKWLMVK